MLEQEMRQMVEADFDAHRASGERQNYYLNHCSFNRGGETLEAVYLPKLFDQKTKKKFEWIVETTYGIFEKIILHYIEDADYRKGFGFPREIEELICVPNLYRSYLPQARFDIFYHEADESFGFCEINADGAGAMNRQLELQNSLKENLLYRQLSDKYQFEMYDPIDQCIHALLDLYDTYEKKIDHPNIAVLDFLYEGSSLAEFEIFAERFRSMGYQAQVCDVTKVRYHDGALYAPDGMRIDLVYRRAVTTDLISHLDEVQDFLQAIRSQDACVMGSICTQVVHNKSLSVMLHRPETLELLTPEEQAFVKEHFPYTARLTEAERSRYEADKDRWIIKPEDSYMCDGVYLGTDVEQEEWNRLLQECAGKPYIIQELYPYERTDNIDFAAEHPRFEQYVNMEGLYVFGGHLGGVFHRQAVGNAIISEVNERSLPTLFLAP